MRRISAGLAACLAAAVTAGCGSVQAVPSAHQGQRSGPPATAPNGGLLPAGCHRAASVITQADNGKTFCVRVGGTVAVLLHGSDARPWLPPLASGSALKPVPGGGASLVRGMTGARFGAVRPGQAVVTSVRPPCEVAISMGKVDLQPSDSVPRFYPLKLCA